MFPFKNLLNSFNAFFRISLVAKSLNNQVYVHMIMIVTLLTGDGGGEREREATVIMTTLM